MNSKSLVRANDITSNAKTVRDLKTDSAAELRQMFTGNPGQDLLFVSTGDYVMSKGITLKSQSNPSDDGLNAIGWTNQIKKYAASIGDEENPDIVRKSYSGITLWNVDWLEVHFPEIRRRAKAAKQTTVYW